MESQHQVLIKEPGMDILHNWVEITQEVSIRMPKTIFSSLNEIQFLVKKPTVDMSPMVWTGIHFIYSK